MANTLHHAAMFDALVTQLKTEAVELGATVAEKHAEFLNEAAHRSLQLAGDAKSQEWLLAWMANRQLNLELESQEMWDDAVLEALAATATTVMAVVSRLLYGWSGIPPARTATAPHRRRWT